MKIILPDPVFIAWGKISKFREFSCDINAQTYPHIMILEFHCHTYVSKDSLVRPADLVKACRSRGIDRVVITDHNSIRGALEARTLDPDLVIVGEEIMTTRGEILAAFLKEEIPSNLTPRQALLLLKEQGAFISVSHPFDTLRKGGWEEADLLEILPEVDAVEFHNSRCLLPEFNQRALDFATRYSIPGTVGSDAHTLWELGRSVLDLESFSGPDELRKCIRSAIPRVKRSPWWVVFATRYASLRKTLKS